MAEKPKEKAPDKERPLDETVRGGHYLGTDGKPHDADGHPIKGKATDDTSVESSAGTEA